MRFLVLAALGLLAQSAAADEVSLRLGGAEISLGPPLRERLAVLARQVLGRCGPNTTQHPGNFGMAVFGVEERWQRAFEGSRLRVRL